jgi:hypothetical protein
MGYELDAPAQGSAAQGYQLDPPSQDKPRAFDLDTAYEAVSNLPKSFVKQIGQTVEGVGHAIMNSTETAKGVGKLALSVSPVLPSTTEVGKAVQSAVDQVPMLGSGVALVRSALQTLAPMLGEETQGKLKELMADVDGPKKAIIEDYVQAYGDKQAFLKTLATDPARILSDIALIAAPAAGMPGRVGQVARVASALDPVQTTINAAGLAGRAGLHALDVTTQTGEGVMREALRTGFEGGTQSPAYRTALRGEVPMEDIVGAANDALNTQRQAMMADYRATQGHWSNATRPIPFTDINRAQADVFNSIRTRSGSNVHMKVSEADGRRIQNLFDIVAEWRNDPTTHTIEGLDGLKQRLRNEIDFRNDSPQVVRAAQQLTNAVRNTVSSNAPPAYRAAMRAYGEASQAIENLERAFGLGRKGNIQTAMSKLQSAMRNNANTQYGHRNQLLGRLDEAAGTDLRATLAGHASSSLAPRGIARGVLGAGAPLGLGMLAGAATPLTAGAAAAGLAMTSPRLMGEALHGIGRVAGAPMRLSRRMPQRAQDVLGTAGTLAFSPLGYGAARVGDRQTNDPFDVHYRGGSVR